MTSDEILRRFFSVALARPNHAPASLPLYDYMKFHPTIFVQLFIFKNYGAGHNLAPTPYLPGLPEWGPNRTTLETYADRNCILEPFSSTSPTRMSFQTKARHSYLGLENIQQYGATARGG